MILCCQGAVHTLPENREGAQGVPGSTAAGRVPVLTSLWLPPSMHFSSRIFVNLCVKTPLHPRSDSLFIHVNVFPVLFPYPKHDGKPQHVNKD